MHLLPDREDRLLARLIDVYESLARGYPVYPESYIGGDGKEAIESIGAVLDEFGARPTVRIKKRDGE